MHTCPTYTCVKQTFLKTWGAVLQRGRSHITAKSRASDKVNLFLNVFAAALPPEVLLWPFTSYSCPNFYPHLICSLLFPHRNRKKISGSVSGRKSQPSTYFVQVPANFCVFSFILNSSTYCHYFSISRSFLPQNNFGDSCEDHFHPCYRMHKSMKGRKNEIKPKGKTDGS